MRVQPPNCTVLCERIHPWSSRKTAELVPAKQPTQGFKAASQSSYPTPCAGENVFSSGQFPLNLITSGHLMHT